MKITKYVLAAVALTAVGQNAIAADAAPADSKSGSFYVSAGTGYGAFPEKTYTYSDFTTGTPLTAAVTSKSKGFTHSVAAGYMLDDNIRAEVELAYGKSSERYFDGATSTDGDKILVALKEKEFGANASAYYSMDLGTASPFVGAGIGIKSHQDTLSDFDSRLVAQGEATPGQGVVETLKADQKFKKQNRLFGKLEAGVSVPVADDCVFLDLSYALSISAKENFDDTDYTQLSNDIAGLLITGLDATAIPAAKFVKSSGKRVGHAVKAKVRFVF